MQRKNPEVSFSAYVGTDEEAQYAQRPHKSAMQMRKPAAAKRVARPVKRSRVWLLLLLLTASMAVLVDQYKDPVLAVLNQPINSVRLETPLHRVSEMEVRSVLAMYLDDGFFGLNVNALKNHLQQHPWIEQAVIRRVWPDALVVAIHEETPIARWGDERLLNQNAEVFQPAEIEEISSLPMLRGPEGSQQMMMEQYQLFNQLLLATGLRMQELKLDTRGSWSAVITGGVLINIGREETAVARLQRFVTLHDRHMHTVMEEVISIDLRYRNGISVGKREISASGVATL